MGTSHRIASHRIVSHRIASVIVQKEHKYDHDQEYNATIKEP